ncbi:MAG: DNA-processing protein DprA [Rubrivivax sp.]|jgi:DNA processing protein
MPAQEFEAWFRLLTAPGMTRPMARRLLRALGSPQAVLGASASQWSAAASPAAAQALSTPDPQADARLQMALDWLAGHPSRRVLNLGDTQYPQPLLHCGDPPLMLFLEGRLDLLQRPSLAVVGSRQATPQGLAHARQFANVLSHAGVTVVSGLATGIDGAAHEGALTGPGSTLAVIGTGPDIVYPSRHGRLWRRIAQDGLVVSEHAPGTPALAHHFPHRNRIIAGLTRGTLVVEATLRSGSLITARLAMEGGREVFAVPGSIQSPQAKGCHELIRQGAQLVESAQEILESLGLPVSPTDSPAPPASAAGAAVPDAPESADGPDDPDPRSPHGRLLRAMGHDPVSLDTLVGRTGDAASVLGARLLELELQGLVARLPGGRFQRQQAG